MRNLDLQSNKGFTLIEVIVSMSIFILVITISLGSILQVFDVNRKSRSMQVVMANLNLALESMAREMRFGENYHCGSSGVITTAQNCPSGDSFVSFLSSDDEQIVYRLVGTTVEKSIDGGSSYTAVTGDEISVESLNFYVLGGGPQSPSLQPKVLIKISGVAGADEDSQTEFSLQTLVSQRVLDE